MLDQMKRCLEAAGSSLERVVKCNVYCTFDETHFGRFNEVYARYFPREDPRVSFYSFPHGQGRSISKLIVSQSCKQQARGEANVAWI